MARSARSRWKRKQAEMTPGAARGVGWSFAVVALLATVGVWWLAVTYSHQRSRLEAFDAAPACVASGSATPPTDTGCREAMTAVVENCEFHGGGKGGGYSSVDLRLTDSGLVTTRMNGSPFSIGEPVVVTLWHGQAALVQPAAPGRTPIATLTSPQYNVGNDATGILVLMAFVLGLGTASWGVSTYYLMRRWRAAPVHAVALAMFAVVVTLRVRNDYGALTTVAYAEPPVFLALIIGWLVVLRLRVRAGSDS